MSASAMSHEWCEVLLKIDRATAVTMSRRGTTQHNSAQHELAVCDRCHTAWASGAHGWVPAGHPRYTRADYGQEAVGGSTSRARARDTGGDQTAWKRSVGARHRDTW